MGRHNFIDGVLQVPDTETLADLDFFEGNSDLVETIKSESPITGIPVQFEKAPPRVVEFVSEVAERRGIMFVISVDLDDLKRLNDSVGHDNANDVIRDFFNEKINRFDFPGKIAARFWQPQMGGDELKMVIAYIPEERNVERRVNQIQKTFLGIEKRKDFALQLANMVQQIFGKQLSFVFGDETFDVSCSHGAVGHDFSTDKTLKKINFKELLQNLFDQAEIELSQFKTNKKNLLADMLKKQAEGMSVAAFKNAAIAAMAGVWIKIYWASLLNWSRRLQGLKKEPRILPCPIIR